MKIGIDISQIVYQTGVSRYTLELVKHLLQIDTANRYFLYAGTVRQKKLLRAFIKQVSTKKTSSRITHLSPKLADIFWNQLNLFPPDRGQNLDIFHASNWALPKTKAKLVTTIHDLTFLKYPESHTEKSIQVHTRHLKRAKKLADHIITDSESTKKDLIANQVPADKISVVYPAPAKIFEPLSSDKTKPILKKYNLEGRYILSVGTQEPRKNLPNLIKAYAQLKDPKPILAIAGKFGWGDQVKPVKGVQLLGFVPDEDLIGLYSAAKVFVYPSLYEGFGFPILEAFSCGCPVITSNISSLPELGGQAAIYANPRQPSEISDAIDLVLNLNSEKRQQLIDKSLAQAKQFSWEKTARQTLKIYQEVVNVDRS